MFKKCEPRHLKKMRVEKPNPDEWWWEASSELRTFCRDVTKLVDDVRDDEVLEVRFNGRSFTPVLRPKPDRETEPVLTGGRFKPSEQSPEKWWTGVVPGQREFIQELAAMVRDVQRDRDKALEITNTGGAFKVTLVLNFKRPTGGKAATN